MDINMKSKSEIDKEFVIHKIKSIQPELKILGIKKFVTLDP